MEKDQDKSTGYDDRKSVHHQCIEPSDIEPSLECGKPGACDYCDTAELEMRLQRVETGEGVDAADNLEDDALYLAAELRRRQQVDLRSGKPLETPTTADGSSAEPVKARELGCQCTYEQGDSDCPVHVQCSECGADISHQTVVRERARLAAEVKRLRKSTSDEKLGKAREALMALAEECPMPEWFIQKPGSDEATMRDDISPDEVLIGVRTTIKALTDKVIELEEERQDHVHASDEKLGKARIEADGGYSSLSIDQVIAMVVTRFPAGVDNWMRVADLLVDEVRRLREEAKLWNDMVKDADERALGDARAEVSEGVVALEGVCRDLSVENDRLREEMARERRDFEQHRMIQRTAIDNCEREISRLRADNERLDDQVDDLTEQLTAANAKLARVEALPASWVSRNAKLNRQLQCDELLTADRCADELEAVLSDDQPRDPKLPYNGY